MHFKHEDVKRGLTKLLSGTHTDFCILKQLNDSCFEMEKSGKVQKLTCLKHDNWLEPLLLCKKKIEKEKHVSTFSHE